jgi:hypothetical protein
VGEYFQKMADLPTGVLEEVATEQRISGRGARHYRGFTTIFRLATSPESLTVAEARPFGS